MTTPRSGAVVRYADHTVVATPAEAAVLLEAAQLQRRLVYASAPRPWPADPYKVMFRMRLAIPVTAPAQVRLPANRRWGVLGLAGVGLATVSGVLWLVISVVRFITENWQAIIGGVFVAALLLWFAAGRVGACPGIHCFCCKC